VNDQAIQLLDVTPSIDLFAFRPDPEAQTINAFHISWVNMCFYAFPPFYIINQELQKIAEEKATGIIVIPHWPTQSWWLYLTNMLINCPLMLPSTQTTHDVTIPSSEDSSSIKEVAITDVPLIGGLLESKGISKETASIIVYKHGDRGLKNSTNAIYKSGNSTVVNEVSIPLLQM
jgi:hypothetical protein